MSKIEVNAIEPQCGTDLTVGASGDTITFPTGTTIVNNGTQTGFGRTGTVNLSIVVTHMKSLMQAQQLHKQVETKS